MATNLRYDSKKIRNNLSEPEQIIKAQLKSWIDDVQKKAELEHRLKMAFKNSKSHTKSLSQV